MFKRYAYSYIQEELKPVGWVKYGKIHYRQMVNHAILSQKEENAMRVYWSDKLPNIAVDSKPFRAHLLISRTLGKTHSD